MGTQTANSVFKRYTSYKYIWILQAALDITIDNKACG